MQKRSQTEIENLIWKLSESKNTVPPESFFGDPNHLAIDAQIRVLRFNLKEDEIETEYAAKNKKEEYVKNMALLAYDWLICDVEEEDICC